MPVARLKKALLAIMLCFVFLSGYTQHSNWLTGLWKEKTDPKLNSKNLIIDSVKGSSFTGIIILKQKGLPVIIDMEGSYTSSRLVFKGTAILSGEISQKDYTPLCLSCVPENTLTIKNDSLLLTSRILACNDSCNGVDIYYRLLCEFDEPTQLYLVKNFGSAGSISAFVACKETPAILEEKKRLKQIEDSTTNLVLIAQLRKKRLEERLAFESDEREKLKRDSIKAAIAYKQKHEKEIQDSLNEVAAKIKQQRIEDSIAAVKKRRQEIEDSLQIIAKQKEQGRLDSLNAVAAKIKQQRIEDSVAAVRKTIDSNDPVSEKRKKQIADSLENIAVIQRQRTKDSLSKALAAKEQRAILDSLQTARSRPATIKEKVLEERGNILLGAYHIKTPDIIVDLFDNGEVDGDRISVFHNNMPVVNNELLSTKPISFTIHADTLNRQHEFILVADNLGNIPPNSALMRITVGKETYKLFVKTDLSTNAKILFYYDGD